MPRTLRLTSRSSGAAERSRLAMACAVLAVFATAGDVSLRVERALVHRADSLGIAAPSPAAVGPIVRPADRPAGSLDPAAARDAKWTAEDLASARAGAWAAARCSSPRATASPTLLRWTLSHGTTTSLS